VSAPVRVLIVDDEPPARRTLADLVAADPEAVVAGECGSGAEAVEAIRRLAPDVVLLDVQMPELDGFGVLAALAPAEIPLVVFVTAYDRYAVRAFEIHALDYLLKPFDDERFAAALGRAKEAIRRREVDEIGRRLAELLAERRGEAAGAEPAGDAPLKRLLIRGGGRVVLLPVEEIDWIEAADYYARVHAGGVRHLIRESLSALEEKLDPARFARVHRSAIVNLDRVRELRPLFKGNCLVVLADGTELPLGRARRASVESLLRRGR
jgi:two-component system, LytTR family, response regulator